MKLEKAIEILRDSIADDTLLITLEHDAAVKLSIEALKRIRAIRNADPRHRINLLQGETEK